MNRSFQPALSCKPLREGTLFYIVGTSGEGKARLLQYARAQLNDDHFVVFAYRYITRSTDVDREYEIPLSTVEFALRKRHGLFAMNWESGRLMYGVGTEINYWLAKGLSVVVKGSRAYLGQALLAYPDMTVIWVTADTGAASRRATRRACEFRPDSMEEAVSASWHRSRVLGSRVVHISSDGALSLAGKKLVSVLAGNAN